MTSRPHILITGRNGFLGQHLNNHPGMAGMQVTSLSRTQADICCDLADTDALAAALEQVKPDIILNLAAMTRIQDCENNPDLAMAVNGIAVQHMADWCHKNATYMIQVSTDHVFDRGGWALHTEESAPNPPNQYGKSKLAGEEAALSCPHAMILRTHFMGLDKHHPQAGFAGSLFAALAGERPIPFFMDSYATPLHVSDFCDFLLALMEKRITGLVHVGGLEPVSRYGLAVTLAAKCGIDVKTLQAGSIDHVDMPLGKDLGLDSGYAAWLLDKPLPDLNRLTDLLAKDFDSWRQAQQTSGNEKVS